MNKIILASASPRRKELLEHAGVVFQVKPGNGEEIIVSSEPEKIVEELSLQKAQFVIDETEEGTIIIGADTIVAYEGKILGKPADREDAMRTLQMLQGKSHQVYTGVTVRWMKNGEWKHYTFAEKTDVTFYPVSDAEIAEYVASGQADDKAGSYGIQGLFGIYVKGICGDYSNVVGLPVARLLYETKKLGLNLRG